MASKEHQAAAKAAEKWKTRFEEERSAHESTKRGAEEGLTLLGAGVADEIDQQLVRWKYNQLPEEGRPTLADYLKGPALEDRHLAGILKPAEGAGAEGAGAEGGEGAEAAKKPPIAADVRDSAGVKKPPQIPPGDDVSKIMAMTPEQWTASRAEFLG